MLKGSMIFTEASAHFVRLCANKPIHFIVSTLIVSSVFYLTIFDHYISKVNNASYNSLTFYHAPGNTNSSQWNIVANDTEFNFLNEPSSDSPVSHYIVTPLIFRAHSKNVPLPVNTTSLLSGSDRHERFFISNISSVAVPPETFENVDGDIFKLRPSNRLGRYYEYFKSMASIIKNAAAGAEPLDLIMVALAYAAMLFSVIQLFYEMRRAGSKFWLAFGSLLSSVIAFLFAIIICTEIFGIDLPLASMSEGIPFLVAAVGFRHKIAYTVPIMNAIRKNPRSNIADTMSKVVLTTTASPLIKEEVLAAIIAGTVAIFSSNLTGLYNFCILIAVLMITDLFITFTFYSAIISLKAQINTVHRQIELREALEEEGVSTDVATSVAVANTDGNQKQLFEHNGSIWVFKIVLILGFLCLHLFALGTSWLYDDLSDFSASTSLFSYSSSEYLTHSLADKVPIGNNGTLITVMPAKIYRRITLVTNLEDLLFDFISRISLAIRDPYVSKFLFMVAGVSSAINVYLLNVARNHLFIEAQSSMSSKKVEQSENVSSTKSENSRPLSVEKKATKNEKSTKPHTFSHSKSRKVVSDSVDSSTNSADNVKDHEIVEDSSEDESVRPLDELVEIMKAGKVSEELNDAEVCELATRGKMPLYALEKHLGDTTRAVVVRRKAIAKLANAPVLTSGRVPWKDYNYDRVFGACCENVIGYIPLPLGIAGPLIIDGVPYHIPMATAEGCLVASTMRGCKALNAGGGVETELTSDGMTRGPCVRFPSLSRAGTAKRWLDSEEGQKSVKEAFNSTSRFARLQHARTALAGTLLFIRFKTTTGDAMGMNMISKGVEYALKYMQEKCGFDDMDVVSLSGNYCTDKKPAAINWIEGRGKSVVAAATVPADVVKKVLKSDVDALVKLNIDKNLVGSAMAGSIGGNNAQAANLVTAVYLATGQDPAQNVESSSCITLMEKLPNGDLSISVSMPSIEVGTIGGGTILEAQAAMLELLGVRGPNQKHPGANARQLAKIVASAVLAAELSLCSALAAGHLVRAHMQHNRNSNLKSGAVKKIAPTPATADGVVKKDDVKRLKQGSKICIKS